MSRKSARETVFKMLFPINFNINEEYMVDYDQILESVGSEQPLLDEDKDFVKEEYLGIIKNKQEILSIIEPNLNGFSLSRVYKPDLVALMIAVYELKYQKEIPSKVAVNEVLNLCKKYSTDKSSSFVNGVLAKIIKEID